MSIEEIIGLRWHTTKYLRTYICLLLRDDGVVRPDGKEDDGRAAEVEGAECAPVREERRAAPRDRPRLRQPRRPNGLAGGRQGVIPFQSGQGHFAPRPQAPPRRPHRVRWHQAVPDNRDRPQEGGRMRFARLVLVPRRAPPNAAGASIARPPTAPIPPCLCPAATDLSPRAALGTSPSGQLSVPHNAQQHPH